jgi:hypothetical protein
MARFTVVAAYRDPPSIFCTTVDADNAEDALGAAWGECAGGNGWESDDVDRSDEWADTMVLKGDVDVVL